MMSSLRQLMTCRWSAHRIQRYLDADPSASLSAGEVARLEAHLAICQTCSQTAAEHRALHRALHRWAAPGPDPQAVRRLEDYAREVAGRDVAGRDVAGRDVAGRDPSEPD